MQKRRKADITLTSDQKRILWQIKTHGPAARSTLAADLDMHNAFVTRLVRELLMLGCLDEQNGQLVGRGRPVVPLMLSGRAGYSAGAMVHPGWLELVLVDFAGGVIAKHHEPFSSADPRAFIELVDVRLRELALENNVILGSWDSASRSPVPLPKSVLHIGGLSNSSKGGVLLSIPSFLRITWVCLCGSKMNRRLRALRIFMTVDLSGPASLRSRCS